MGPLGPMCPMGPMRPMGPMGPMGPMDPMGPMGPWVQGSLGPKCPSSGPVWAGLGRFTREAKAARGRLI